MLLYVDLTVERRQGFPDIAAKLDIWCDLIWGSFNEEQS